MHYDDNAPKFYVYDNSVFHRPIKSDTGITMGFRVCRAEPFVTGAAEEICNALNAAEEVSDEGRSWKEEARIATERVAHLEALRPHWAQGYTSDSIAAQCCLDATLALWKLLGVNNQTEAVIRLRKLLNLCEDQGCPQSNIDHVHP